MKVLAIRGCNIASLAEPFEVDLQREPLASASLYAIAGPTGAGKSSLLDALCVALYDQTPRTTSAPAYGGELPEVDASVISARDSRQLLHRGASEGHAEVDFIGVDQIAYRARWSVRRAHGKRGGRLQKSRLSLHRLPDLTPVADVGNKSEALEAIRAKVGLDYRQFTRAVLLAQNEFAAFLRADQDERAQLLQALTGSERFERLSIAAYQRARLELSRLELLQQQLQASPILSDAERAALEQRWESARGQRDGLRARLDLLRQWQRWVQQQDKLAATLTQAADELVQAQAAQQGAAPRRRELDRLRLLHELRLPWRRLTELNGLRESQEAELVRARKALQATLDRELARQAEVELSRRALVQQRAQAQLITPELQQAERLDEELLQQTEAQQRQQQALARQQQELEQQSQQLAAAEVQQQTLRELIEALRTELQSSSAESWLLQPEQAWQADLEQLAQLRDTARLAAAEQLQALEALTELLREQKRVEAERQSLADQHVSALARQASCEAQLQDARFEQLAARRVDIHGRIQAHTARAFDLRQWQSLEAERERRALRLDQLRQALDASELRLPELQTAVSAAEGARIQAESALHAAELAAGKSAVELRAGLKPEQPCPVCGSREHPYADTKVLLAEHASVVTPASGQDPVQAQPLQRLLQALLQQRAQAHATEQARREQLTGAQTEAAAARTELQRLEEEGSAARLLSQALQTALRADPQARGLLALTNAELEHALQSRHTELNAEAAGLAELEQQRALAEQALRESNAACRSIAEGLSHLQQRISSTDAAIATARQRQAAADTAQHLQQLRLEQHRVRVERWLQPLGRSADEPDLRALQLELQQRATDRQASERVLADKNSELHGLEQSLPRQRALLEAQQSTAGEAAESFRRAELMLQRLQEQRSSLLGGQSSQTVRTGLEQSARAAETAVERAVESAHQARIELAEAQTRVSQLDQQQQQIDAQRLELGSDLRRRWQALQIEYAALAGIEPALAARLLDGLETAAGANAAEDAALLIARSALEAALATEQSQLDREQAALAHIDEAVQLASQAHSMRLQACQSHAEEQPAGIRPADTAQAVQEASSELATLEQDCSAIASERIRDDQARQQATQLATAIAAQGSVSQRWNQLSELIGSADGKKFRNLAQQRSLQLLLRHGNQQLRQLGSRYSLRPLKDQLNFLLVDQDLGGELRSVHSLSGGESFLVSLALALALAQLSSQQLAIESLFVDEGFGSLDEDTLNTAMHALDRLQAQGRKVGVISHLRELTERIGVQIEVQPQRAGRSRVVVRQQ